jgi:hypothetical protein
MVQMEGKSPSERAAALQAFEAEEKQSMLDARRQLRGTYIMSGVLAGTMGMPFATVMFGAANLVASIFGSDGDDDEDIRNAFRRHVNAAFGPEMGGMITNGVPRLGGAGIDVQGNIGLQDLMPFSRFLADRREWKDKLPSLMNDASGAFVGASEKALIGLTKIYDGNVIEGLQDMVPKAIAAPIAGIKLAAGGEFKDAKGNPLPMEASAWDALLTAANFTPIEKKDRDFKNRMYQSEQYLANKDAEGFRKQYAEGRRTGDRALIAEAIQGLKEYNSTHPQARISPMQLESNYRAKAKQYAVAKVTGTGIMVGVKDVPKLQDYKW